MPNQTLTWTAVPNGVEGDVAKLVCVVNPRLTGTGALTVAAFPDWVDWATRAAGFTFQVQFDSRTPVTATRVSAAPDPKRWAALVSKDLAVRPFQFYDHSAHQILSYGAGNIVDIFRRDYVREGLRTPTEFPRVDDVVESAVGGNAFGPWPMKKSKLRAYLDIVRKRDGAVPPVPLDGAGQPLLEFVQATLFHEVPAESAVGKEKPAAFDPDFHQLATLLQQYPALQRRLGLVFDLTVPRGAADGASTVRVIANWTPALGGTVESRPTTRCLVSAGRFSPAPDSGSILDQDMLKLASPDFRVVTLDTDGAVLKARQFSENLFRSQRNAPDTPDLTSLPALRNGGLGLVHTGRALRLAGLFKNSKALDAALQSNGAYSLSADALLFGLRWAVLDTKSGRWFSLCDRRGTYKFLKDRSLDLQLSDMGSVTTSVTHTNEHRPTFDYLLSEFLCRWEGESLVAQRPGKSIDRDPSQQPSEPGNHPPPQIPLQVDFAPEPGTLPPLRYGRSYRLRAFATYLGGAGPKFVSAAAPVDPAYSSAEVMYRRLEPVPPPVVAMRKPRVPGESVHTLIIRSDFDTEAAKTTPTERHILPPKASQQLAELHGLFDTPTGLDRNAYATILARTGGSLDQGGTPEPGDQGQRYYDVDKLSFPVENGKTAEVPWLVDPFARGVALSPLPGAPNGFRVGFSEDVEKDWRAVRPIRLQIVEGTGGLSFDSAKRILTVRLGKADVADVRLSSQLGVGDLPLLEVWDWLQTELTRTGGDVSRHRTYAYNGQHWMLSPPQPLKIVHAVRRPLVRPFFRSYGSARVLGSTIAKFTANLEISRKSTGSLDVSAYWSDPVDTLDATGWQPRKMVVHRSQLRSTAVKHADANNPEDSISLALDHDLGDNAAHVVGYTATGKSRFAEHFPEMSTATVTVNGDWFTPVDAVGFAPGSLTVTKSGSTTVYTQDTDYEVDDLEGRIRPIPGGKIVAGTTLAVTYQRSFSRSTNQGSFQIVSSARPAPPKPLYVVPTFGWWTSTDSTRHTKERKGGGLRVYLDRPWWSSGDNEKLGVVVWTPPASATEVDEGMKPYVTQWGADPLYGAQSGGLPGIVPTLDMFTAATRKHSAVELAESGRLVDVAAHDVSPDLERKLWYCDIALSPSWSHQPFVRLALVRYQPQSMAKAEISPVVLADFAQLASDRSASVTFGADGKTVTVGVSGKSGSTLPDGSQFSAIELTVERRIAGIPGDLGWMEVGKRRQLQELKGQPIGTKTWTSGEVTLPAIRGTEPMRLVVREYDVIGSFSRRLTYTDVLNV